MAEALRAGVVGVGHLGALHAAKYRATEGVELIGLHDIDGDRAVERAAGLDCRVFDRARDLFAAVDCVSIAAPTAVHAALATEAIQAGVHVLVEKPLASSFEDAAGLVEAAASAGVLLQVGHLERFNPAFADLPSIVAHPRFIECHRLAPFAGRGVDTDVVFDVMIHDLDLIAFVVGRPLVSAEAIGVPVLSGHSDIANARLRFEGGCIANVTASRVSLKRERRLRIFQEDAYVAVDFDSRTLRIVRRRAGSGPVDPAAPMDGIEMEERTFADDADPLRDQIAAFAADAARAVGARAVRAPSLPSGGRASSAESASPAAVSGREALVALEIAERVRQAVAREAGAVAQQAEGSEDASAGKTP